MEHPRNPFILGHRISRPYFCDRQEEVAKLTSSVLNGRHSVLISPRRMGKTSLVYVALNETPEIEENFLTFFFDILQTNSLAEFTFLLGKAIFEKLKKRSESALKTFLATLKSLKGTFGFDSFTGTPTFNLQLGDLHDPQYTLKEIFKFLEDSEKPVIIVIDEFQQIAKYPEKNIEALLRSHIQGMTNATFIFSGSEQSLLKEMFIDANRPFYNSTEIMHLGPIPVDIYTDFAADLFHQRGKRLDKTAIPRIFTLFDGNTFYMQRTMNGAFSYVVEGQTCGKEDLERAVHEMLASNEVIYREILSNITNSQKALLLAIAQERFATSPTSSAFIKKHALASASSVQSALKILMRNNLIVKEPQGYRLNDPLFRIFLNNTYSIPEI